MNQYFIIYKPYGVLSQFTKEMEHHQTLAGLYDFPSHVYPVGRLDKDSEGLLILTNDTKLNHRLLNPKFVHERNYWVQVEGVPTQEAIDQLTNGVTIKINKKQYLTKPAKAILLTESPNLPPRNPPVRFRKNIPTSWIALTLSEGKNRQVRRMCAKVGFPVLRLVRASIENLMLGDMAIGEVQRIDEKELKGKLFKS